MYRDSFYVRQRAISIEDLQEKEEKLQKYYKRELIFFRALVKLIAESDLSWSIV